MICPNNELYLITHFTMRRARAFRQLGPTGSRIFLPLVHDKSVSTRKHRDGIAQIYSNAIYEIFDNNYLKKKKVRNNTNTALPHRTTHLARSHTQLYTYPTIF